MTAAGHMTATVSAEAIAKVDARRPNYGEAKLQPTSGGQITAKPNYGDAGAK
jgi:hypothetical protein